MRGKQATNTSTVLGKYHFYQPLVSLISFRVILLYPPFYCSIYIIFSIIDLLFVNIKNGKSLITTLNNTKKNIIINY